MMPPDHAVTTWIGLLRDGDTDAARHLWQRYFGRLVEFARGKLHGTSRRPLTKKTSPSPPSTAFAPPPTASPS